MGRIGLLGRILRQQRCWQRQTQLKEQRSNLSTIASRCLSVNLPIINNLQASNLTSWWTNGDIGFCVPCRTMAGHSHWQNIRHTKAAADAKKQAIIGTYQIQLKGAIHEGGPDPEKNSKLNSILEKMRAANIPKADIKRYLENATRKASSTQTVYVEVRGPQGSVFVVELDAEFPKKSKDMVNALVKKTIGKVQAVPSFQNVFEMKGVIVVPVTKEMDVTNMDPYLEIAIESGAEDVILTKNDDAGEDGETDLVLKFHTDPKTVKQVAKEIEETHNLEVSLSQVELFPYQFVNIESQEDIEACRKIAEKLQSHDEFVNLFDNISVPEEK